MDYTGWQISQIARIVRRFTAKTLKEDGIGFSELDVIRVVTLHPGITQSELCRRLIIDKGALARQVRSLENKGFIERKPNPEDGRSQLLFATETANVFKRSKSHIEEVFYEWMEEELSTDDRKQLEKCLDVMYERCQEENAEEFENILRKLENKATK